MIALLWTFSTVVTKADAHLRFESATKLKLLNQTVPELMLKELMVKFANKTLTDTDLMCVCELRHELELLSLQNNASELNDASELEDTSESKLASHVGPNSCASIADSTSKIMVIAEPKAGATLAMRLLLARLNLTSVAFDSGGYPLKYTHEVFDKQPGRRPPQGMSDLQKCADDSWLCVRIVRNPLDRAISSYIHAMKYAVVSQQFHELKHACGKSAKDCQRNASFFEFTRALLLRARNKKQSEYEDHYLPQAWKSDSIGLTKGVLYVPIEIFDNSGSVTRDFTPLAKLEPWRVAEQEKLTAMHNHYIQRNVTVAAGSEHWDFGRVHDAIKTNRLPAYDSFWVGNKTLCREVVAGLYEADMHLYLSTCSQASLRQYAVYANACDKEMARLRDVCGLQI